ncbi:MAG: tryptophan synthase subunit alpha [Flavobacteriales bacterium]|nr:tryptophan synthase subunit alpha [Flavobacteriales bacterium]
MSRIDQLFEKKQKEVLTIYFTAGHPQLNDTVDIIRHLDEAGADLIEVGMPYSDPLADGPVIQQSSEKALANGMNLNLLFEQLTKVRNHSQIPMVLMGYYNQVLQYGIERFCAEANRVGVDGLILPDLPLEEYYENCKSTFDKYGLTCTFLVTPSSSNERIKELDNASSGFLYAVSSHSITGGNAATQLTDYGAKLDALSLKNPIQVGFGIRDFTSFQNACEIAHGGIIGSAFIRALEQKGELKTKINGFIKSIRQHT